MNDDIKKKKSYIWVVDRDFLQELLDSSSSYGEVLKVLGISNKGGNPRTLKQRIKIDNLNLSKLDANRKIKNKLKLLQFAIIHKPIQEFLVINSSASRNSLKKRLLKEGYLKNQCYICGQLPEWNGKPLSLQIDHINGISNDNRLENLRILCPHCHSQTDTFAGKNILKNPQIKRPPKIKLKNAPRLNTRKVIRPSKEELEKLLWKKPTMQLAKEFGVSDSAISKWAKIYGILKPPRGYWAKINTYPRQTKCPTKEVLEFHLKEMTITQLAKYFGVHRKTLLVWKKNFGIA